MAFVTIFEENMLEIVFYKGFSCVFYMYVKLIYLYVKMCSDQIVMIYR